MCVRRWIFCLLWALAACTGPHEEQAAAPKPVVDEQALQEAQTLQEEGRFQDSAALLRKVLRQAPDNPEANYLLGAALAQSGQPSLAVWPLRKAVASQEYAVSAGTALARVFLGTRNFLEAVRAADAVLKLKPEHLPTLRVRAKAQINAGNAEKGLADADRLLGLVPNDIAALALRADALAALKRSKEAEQAHFKRMEAAEDSDNPAAVGQACIALAEFYAKDEEDDKRAEAAFVDCVERLPLDLGVLNAATEFFDDHDKPDEATTFWRRALAGAAGNPGIATSLAGRVETAGRLDEAEKLLRDTATSVDSSAAWQNLAHFYRRKGDLDKANAALEHAIGLAGEDREMLLFTQADVLVQLGKIDEAKQIAAGLEQDALRELIRGRVLFAEEKYSEAMEALNRGLERWPNNAAAHFLAAQTAARLGDFKRAFAEYHATIRADREGSDGAIAAARLHLALGEYEPAIEFAQMHMRFHKPAPGPEAAVIIARAFTALGRYGMARAVIERLYENEDEKLTAAVELAKIEYEVSGATAAAQEIRQSGLALTDPANEAALRALIEYLIEDGDSDGALKEIKAALSHERQSAPLRDIRGRVLLHMNRLAEAKASFKKALAVDGHYAPAIAGMAGTLAAEGNTAKAIELYDRAFRRNPADVDSAYGAARLVLAAGDKEAAVERLERLIRTAPGQAAACNDLAWILADDGRDLDRALDLAQRANRIEPTANSLDTLGWVQLARGEAGAAGTSFRQALERQPDSALFRYHLGRALDAANDVAGALDAYRKALASGSLAQAEALKARVAQLDRAVHEPPAQ